LSSFSSCIGKIEGAPKSPDYFDAFRRTYPKDQFVATHKLICYHFDVSSFKILEAYHHLQGMQGHRPIPVCTTKIVCFRKYNKEIKFHYSRGLTCFVPAKKVKNKKIP
jgi:hypothetical protein